MHFLLKTKLYLVKKGLEFLKPKPYLVIVLPQYVFNISHLFYLIIAYNPVLQTWYVTDIHFPVNLQIKKSKFWDFMNKKFPQLCHHLRIKFNIGHISGIYSVVKPHIRIEETTQMATIFVNEPITGELLDLKVKEALNMFNKQDLSKPNVYDLKEGSEPRVIN